MAVRADDLDYGPGAEWAERVRREQARHRIKVEQSCPMPLSQGHSVAVEHKNPTQAVERQSELSAVEADPLADAAQLLTSEMFVNQVGHEVPQFISLVRVHDPADEI